MNYEEAMNRTTADFLRLIWPVYVIAVGVILGMIAKAFRRK